MHPVHIVVSVVNAICGVAFILLLVLSDGSLLHTLAAFAVVFGYFANLLAVIITLALLIVLGIRAAQGQGKAYLSHQWLGFLNGSLVSAFWLSFTLYAQIVVS